TLRERVIFGDSAEADVSRGEAARRNLISRRYKQYDEAGLLIFEAYDFKGNVIEKSRRVLSDASLLGVFDNAATNDWQVSPFRTNGNQGLVLYTNATNLPELKFYHPSFGYDSLNRLTDIVYPADSSGDRRHVSLKYGKSSLLQHITIDGEVIVDLVAYNAKG